MVRTTVFLMGILFLFASCMRPAVIRSTEGKFKSEISNVCIKSIDFYTDKEFSKPMTPHRYMETSRNEVHKLAGQLLPEYGFQLANCSGGKEEIHVELDICIIPGIVVGLYIRAMAYHGERMLFEITGDITAAPSEKSIIASQEKLASEFIKKFAEKFGREKKN